MQGTDQTPAGYIKILQRESLLSERACLVGERSYPSLCTLIMLLLPQTTSNYANPMALYRLPSPGLKRCQKTGSITHKCFPMPVLYGNDSLHVYLLMARNRPKPK